MNSAERNKYLSKWHKIRNIRNGARDFIYTRGHPRGNVLTEDDLAEMLHYLLELGPKPPSIKSKIGHRIVQTIFRCIAKELRAGRRVAFPHIGALYLRDINKKSYKKIVAFQIRSDAMERAMTLDDNF